MQVETERCGEMMSIVQVWEEESRVAPTFSTPVFSRSLAEVFWILWDSLSGKHQMKLQGRKEMIPKAVEGHENPWLLESLACVYLRLTGTTSHQYVLNFLWSWWAQPWTFSSSWETSISISTKGLGKLSWGGKSRGNSPGLPASDLEETYPWTKWRLKTPQY